MGWYTTKEFSFYGIYPDIEFPCDDCLVKICCREPCVERDKYFLLMYGHRGVLEKNDIVLCSCRKGLFRTRRGVENKYEIDFLIKRKDVVLLGGNPLC
jgi:hypothetical protein